MKKILRILAVLAVTLGHAAVIYYFYTASWVTLSDFLIFWASLILVGLSMSLLFYIGSIIKIPISGSYYQFAAVEKVGRLYELLGINSSKLILFRSPFVLLSKDLRAKKYKNSQIMELEKKMRIPEFGHVVGFVMVFVLIIPMYQRSWKFAFWLTLLNVLMHLYPIFLQRYNRLRICKLGQPAKRA